MGDDEELGAPDQADPRTGNVETSTATVRGETAPMISFIGDLDVATTNELLQAATEALPSVPPAGLIIDMSRTTFADSRGITSLLRIRRMLDGRPLHLRGVNDSILTTLRLMSIDSQFTFDDSA